MPCIICTGVLRDDPQARAGLATGDSAYTYNFIKNKIADLELTPAQLALDPCTAGCVVTDVKTGEIRALVSYPSYDNNRMSGSVDAAYFAKLQSDMSNPLYNNATQLSSSGVYFQTDHSYCCTGRRSDLPF